MRPLLFVALLAPAAAAAGEPFLKGPYLQNVGKTEITVMWQSDPAAPGRVRVGGQSFDAPATPIHEVRVTGLAPGRRYAYTVECAGKTAAGELVTAPEPSEPFAFVVFGDTRPNPDQHRALVERVRREVPDFILMTGDMVDDGSKESDWQSFFAVERDLLAENVL